MIDARILELIDEMGKADPGITKHRDRLLREIRKRHHLHERRGHIVDRFGREVDLKQIVELTVESDPHITRLTTRLDRAKYVSPWSKPTPAQRAKMAVETKAALETICELRKIVAADKESFQRALTILSENFVYGVDDNGKIVFRKQNGNGLLGSQEFAVDEILISINHLIDRDASRIERELDLAARREVAKKMLDAKARQEHVDKKVDELVQRDMFKKIPRRILPKISKALIEQEFIRREAILTGRDPGVQGGNDYNLLRLAAKQEIEKLDDVGGIQRELKSIEPQISQAWEGLPYE